MKNKKKVVVLLSAGLDSTINAFEAVRRGHEIVLALTFNYGQRAAEKEMAASANIAKHLSVKHKIIELPWFADFNKSSLLVKEQAVPVGDSVEIDNLNKSQETAKSVWVPNRNGIFLNIAAAYAEALEADSVIPGFNLEEATTFPDNSLEFLEKATQSLWYSTGNHVTAECFTGAMNKSDIVKLGQELKVPWELIWPCYFSGEKWCGQCESCLRSKRAFGAAHIDVKHLYKEF